MIRSKIVPEDEQAHYWCVVQRCLTEFHRLTQSAATIKVRQCQKEVEQLPQEMAEFFFTRNRSTSLVESRRENWM